jgi:hypothetical protein
MSQAANSGTGSELGRCSISRHQGEDDEMASNDNSRPISNTPITDAAAATAPDDSRKYDSNADLRVAEDENLRDAAISATGADIDNDHADERPIDRSDDAPETDNSEQDDEQAQAQTVAGQAMAGNSGYQDGEDSVHGGQPNPAAINPDDTQDVVDHMNQMQQSGNIDMDAYRGERNDDDDTEVLGAQGLDPDDLDEHGNKARNGQSMP